MGRKPIPRNANGQYSVKLATVDLLAKKTAEKLFSENPEVDWFDLKIQFEMAFNRHFAIEQGNEIWKAKQ